MTSRLTKWPEQTTEQKDKAISQCKKALALIKVACDFGFSRQRNMSFLKDALTILEDTTKELEGDISSLASQTANIKVIPDWVIEALGLKKRRESIISLIQTNKNALQFFHQSDLSKQQKALALMKENFETIILYLKGKKFSGKALPPKE